MKFSIITYLSLLLFKLTFMPSIKILGWVFIAVLVDFITGVLKAKLAGQLLTSGGFRQTAVKCLQYMGLIIGGIIIGNSFEKDSNLVHWVNDGMLLFILYVEVYSIFENLYALNPNSKVASMIFKPMMTILTIGLEKNSIPSASPKDIEVKSNTSNVDGLTKASVIILCISLLCSCTTLKPSVEKTSVKSDSTYINYKNVDYKVMGATVANAINMDSLLQVLKSTLKPTAPNTNWDSLFTAFKENINPLHDTTTVTDPNTKVQLKYWYDSFGKLQMTCTSKDETIQLLVAEVTKLHKEMETSKTTVLVYKMPKWGCMVIGASIVLCVIALFLIIAIMYQVIKPR